MQQRGVRPYPRQGAGAKRQAAGVGLDPRARELAEAGMQHPARQVERDGAESEPPQRRGVEARSGSEVEDGSAGVELRRETLEPARDRRTITSVREEASRHLVVALARANDSVVHVPWIPIRCAYSGSLTERRANAWRPR